MRPNDIDRLERHVLQEQPKCTVCRTVSTLAAHARELQAFVLDLATHHAAPGPSPEKIAEHYQLVSRAKALCATFESASTPTHAA